MPAPFKQISLLQFTHLLDAPELKRRINAVHMHHTFRPRHRDYRGHDSIVAMWRYHTQARGWADIAQHLTIAPDGTLWLGRNWNLPPASASGHNGNPTAGPFMFEMIGDFDQGRDVLDGPQREVVLTVIAQVQQRFGLAPESLRFHHMMSEKTCPGNGIDYPEIIKAVRERHHALAQEAASDSGSLPVGPFSEAERLPDAELAILRAWLKNTGSRPARGTRAVESPDAEDTHDEELTRFERAQGLEREGIRGLSRTDVDALRPHLVNLNLGRFSEEGEAKSRQQDVDRIFEETLPQALQEAHTRAEPLKLLFYAHGGLVSESKGLELAHRHVAWWRANRVYPIYFIWETGFFETIGQLLRRAQQERARVLGRDLADYTIDPLLETAARVLQGPRIWEGMKAAARLACERDGGAYYVAQRLKEFCNNHKDQVELHAAGHSAGSIFHAHFLSTALKLGVAPFKSVHFLAPAIRVDLFKELLLKSVGGKGIESLSVFTMRRDLERDDDCAGIYRKSLLYLVHYALEPERKTPILGLEEGIRGDSDLKRLFNLGATDGAGEVIWSATDYAIGRSASQARRHGDFDEDAPTLNSVARRVRGLADADPLYQDYPETRARAQESWDESLDWPQDWETIASKPLISPAPPSPYPSSSTPATSTGFLSTPKPTGRRQALCVGIDDYQTSPLAGCVADMRAWAKALQSLGFEAPIILENQQATRARILGSLEQLVSASQPGDVIVFQYAGHGTRFPDLNGDETEDQQDDALCPYDMDSGAYLIDDDIRLVFDRIPAGVNVTCFFDCCHSGSISRFAVGAPRTDGRRNERVRFIKATPEMIAAHARFRAGQSQGRALSGEAVSGGREAMKNIAFAACRDDEVAYEVDGHGEFTLQAAQILYESVQGGLSHAQFQQRITDAFGLTPRQHPRLDCPEARTTDKLLQPVVGAIADNRAQRMDSYNPAAERLLNALKAFIQQPPP